MRYARAGNCMTQPAPAQHIAEPCASKYGAVVACALSPLVRSSRWILHALCTLGSVKSVQAARLQLRQL